MNTVNSEIQPTHFPSMLSIVGSISLISGIVNLLALTAPLFMLQVYDRVLVSRSIPTLVGLSILAGGLYIFQFLLDVIRSRVLIRIGEAFDVKWSTSVHHAIVTLPLRARLPGDGLQPLRDLDNVRVFLSGQGPTAFFDLPWIPLYLGICFLFHFWLGVTALAGAIILVSITLLTNYLTKRRIQDSVKCSAVRNALIDSARRNAEAVRVLGMSSRIRDRWSVVNAEYLSENRSIADLVGALGGLAKCLRIMLQSALLAVGAYLVVTEQTSAGVMIAASIMMGRALAPVDLAIAIWKPFLMALQSWKRITDLLQYVPSDQSVLELPPPKERLTLEAISVVPPGQRKPTIAAISFEMRAGHALGIIGGSGSGKTTLARAIVGAWELASGSVRLDGASLDQWDKDYLGKHIGYLPQSVELFNGTVAENIARFEVNADPEKVIAAAKNAGAHELILKFNNGYETQIGEGGTTLSAGQRQRVALARALFDDPFLVVLDEPNAHLDAEGEFALIRAMAGIKARHGIAIVITHRPSAVELVDVVLIMESGRLKSIGPRADVLANVITRTQHTDEQHLKRNNVHQSGSSLRPGKNATSGGGASHERT